MSSVNSYSFNGQLYPAPQKRFEETVVFVHFYEGNKRLMARHISMVNKMGFDAFAFNLEHGKDWKDLPFTSHFKFGIKHLYAEQIEEVLNEVGGKKIVFAFSNPCASSIEALANRHCSDVAALICDSGPSGKFLKSAYNLYTHEKQIHSLPMRLLATPILSVFWSPLMQYDAHEDLQKFPKDFKILSIRGWKDKLIPPDHIDAVFDPHPHLDWRKLSLPEAGHLVGLRDFPADYEPAVERFLNEVGTKLQIKSEFVNQ